MAIFSLALGAAFLFPQSARADNSCQYAFDGECDDNSVGGTGACAPATDDADCNITSGGPAINTPPVASGPNSCQYAFDGECDDPALGGTGACPIGTDTADCQSGGGGGPVISTPPVASGPNSCQYAFDGECDDPSLGGTGACSIGTDSADCQVGGGGGGGPVIASPLAFCPFTNDGDCDEPNGLNNCPFGTDTADCSNPNSNFGSGSGFAGGGGGGGGGGPVAPVAPVGGPNSCFAFDGDCDEPNGLNNCPFGTDTADCSNPASNFGSGSGFAGGGGGGGGPVAPVSGPNSCFPFDGDCDEPNGLNNCPFGTDTADCSNPNSNFGSGSGFAGGGGGGGGGPVAPVVPVSGPNSCFPFDGDCDEPNGLNNCPFGTDTADCSNPNSNFGSGSGFAGGGGPVVGNPLPFCPFTNDGDCDEPNGLNNCAFGTDTADCSNPNSNFGFGSGFAGGGGGPVIGNPLPFCPFTNDGDCDEPNGLNNCAFGTDTADCSNPNSNFGFGSGFAGGTTIAPRPVVPARPVATPRPQAPPVVATQEVRQIQTALNYFGFNAGGVDGVVGAGTRSAFERFQLASGYPVNGSNRTADQVGFLLGAYSWATSQGGAQQTGLGGQALLAAYRTVLSGVGAPVAVPLPPRQIAQPPVLQPPAVIPRLPGRSGVRTASAICPSPQNSDGFELIYSGYATQYFVDTDGSTGAWLSASDGSYNYDTYYHPYGPFLELWESDAQGAEIPGTRQSVGYAPPLPAVVGPPPAGVIWSGIETATFANGVVEQFTTSVEVSAPVIQLLAPGCSYAATPIRVRRVNQGTGQAYDEGFVYVNDFGIAVYLGSADSGQAFALDPALEIRIRPDDGFGP